MGEEYNDEGPIFYIDIGDGKLLFVWGQWMLDESTYAHTSQSDLEREKENDEDWPPFPSSSFVVHRVNESGEVLRIEIRGDRLKPIRVIKSEDIPLSGRPDSIVLDGNLDGFKIRDDRCKRPAKAPKACDESLTSSPPLRVGDRRSVL